MNRRWITLLLALMLLWSTSCAAAEEGEFPALNDAGFLDSGEFVFENEEKGVWRYASETLRIEIYRREQKKPARVWYEAEVFCAAGSRCCVAGITKQLEHRIIPRHFALPMG